MSDTSTSKPGLVARIRAFLDELGADDAEVETGADEEIEAATADEARAAEIDAAETEETEAEVEGDEPTEPGNGEPVEATPGSSEGDDAETADLRATITDQAALIETLRNRIAELGGEDPTAEETPETEADAEVEEQSEAELVSAFDADYDRRQALLADLTKEK